MGCDIHMFIEYKKPDDNHWRSHGKEIRGTRNYSIFAILASVRGEGNQAKGYPNDCGIEADDAFYIYIDDNPTIESWERTVTTEKANKWVLSGSSWFKPDNQHYVSDPDSHTPSWATVDELQEAIDKDTWNNNECYKAILCTMKFFESEGYKSRLIYWFDN